jgi:N-acetylmuramoyl-L-alanine amidase
MALGIALACPFALSLDAAAQPVVTDIRTGVHTDMTRLVLDISEKVDYQVFVLDKPYRIVVDLPEVGWRLKANQVQYRGLIKGMRFGLFQAGVSRVVIDTLGPVEVRRAFLLPPQGSSGFRFVIDLAAVGGKEFRRSKNPNISAINPAAKTQVATLPKGARKANPKPVIVIDPGHGGVDPGTIGKRGTYEKTVTLGVSRELLKYLSKSNKYKVVLTRNRDVSLRLGDRVVKARRARGDLFISLHADSISRRTVRGASVYTLSEKSSDKEAAALARKENKADIIAGMDFGDQSKDVADILIELAQRETMNLSATFANIAVERLAASVLVLRRSHRYAGFAVLKAPDVPSVLIEMGYLSNAKDERMLSSPKLRRKLVKALARAIDDYFGQRIVQQ